MVTLTEPEFGHCPRCGRNTRRIDRPDALSRHDNSTWVCSECGVDEALREWAGKPAWPGFPRTVANP